MYDAKPIVAKNITELRQNAGMTQAQLAERLNYSDKAVSKWERGESLPDVSVLYEISRLFGVTVDALITDGGSPEGTSSEAFVPGEAARTVGGQSDGERRAKRKRALITGMSVILVWLVATVAFVVFDIVLDVASRPHALAFVYAVPASLVVWLVLNTVWFSRRRNYLIISLLMWTSLGAAVLTLAVFGSLWWQMMLLGVPGQIIILLWSRMGGKK